MGKKIVLLLQGGGALGAFQCGVWNALYPFIRDDGHELVAVAGASIGAINAGLIAHNFHDADGGKGALQDFWRNQAATPPVPFFPAPGEYWCSWNGLLTGLLLGNRALFHPAYQNWNPAGDLFRFHLPYYRTDIAERTLEKTFGRYRGNAPLLAVGATDVKTGKGVLFDSASTTITPKMLAASIAIPLLFSPIQIDGRYYWDGEMRSTTLLPHVHALLREKLPRRDGPDDLLFIVVGMLKSDTERLPSSTIESQYRFLNILLGDKTKFDERPFEIGNEYLRAIERIRGLVGEDDESPLAAAIRQEHEMVLANHQGHVEFLHIGRDQFDYEYISRDFDYSPQYISRLIAQGTKGALDAIDAYRENSDRNVDTNPPERRPRPADGARRPAPRLVQNRID